MRRGSGEVWRSGRREGISSTASSEWGSVGDGDAEEETAKEKFVPIYKKLEALHAITRWEEGGDDGALIDKRGEGRQRRRTSELMDSMQEKEIGEEREWAVLKERLHCYVDGKGVRGQFLPCLVELDTYLLTIYYSPSSEGEYDIFDCQWPGEYNEEQESLIEEGNQTDGLGGDSVVPNSPLPSTPSLYNAFSSGEEGEEDQERQGAKKKTEEKDEVKPESTGFFSRWFKKKAESEVPMIQPPNDLELRFCMIDLRTSTISDGMELGKSFCLKLTTIHGARYYISCKCHRDYRIWRTGIESNKEEALRRDKIGMLKLLTPLALLKHPSSTASVTSVSPSLAAYFQLIHQQSQYSDAEGLAVDLQETVQTFSPEELSGLDSQLKRQLWKHPEDGRSIIMHHLDMILRIEHHPLGSLLSRFVNNWVRDHHDNVYTTNTRTVLSSAIEPIRTFQDDMLQAVHYHYRKELKGFPRSRSFSAISVEEVLFEELSPFLHPLYKKLYANENVMYNHNMFAYSTITPAHFGLAGDLWLISPDASRRPYQSAIDIFRRMRVEKAPAGKWSVLWGTIRSIQQCITDYAVSMQDELGEYERDLDVDEMLGLFAHVLIRSDEGNLFSDVHFLEDFSRDIQLQDGGMTALTLFKAAVWLVCAIDNDAFESGQTLGAVLRSSLPVVCSSEREDATYTGTSPGGVVTEEDCELGEYGFENRDRGKRPNSVMSASSLSHYPASPSHLSPPSLSPSSTDDDVGTTVLSMTEIDLKSQHDNLSSEIGTSA